MVAAFNELNAGKYEIKVLCDPDTSATVLVQITYDGDGAIVSIDGFHFDGTPYVGDLDLLVSCICDIALSEESGNQLSLSDGLYQGAYSDKFGYFGDGSDGNITLTAANVIILRNQYYENLTITDTGSAPVVNTNGSKIFVRDTLTIGANTKLQISPNDSTNAVGIAGGTRGNQLPNHTLPGATFGGLSRNGVLGAGGAGSPGTDGFGLGASGGAGGAGGTGGAGGGGGNITLSPVRYFTPDIMYGRNKQYGGCGGGGGGSGGGTGAQTGGGSGGGGSGGGVMLVFARHIVNNGQLNAKGGNGGNGALGTAANRGGGGGGGGGGGAIFLCYETYSGAGTISVAGGNGGTAGTGGTNGTAGGTGATLKFNISTNQFD